MKAIAYHCNGLGNWVLQMPAVAAVASMTESKTIDICTYDGWKDNRRPAFEEICRLWPVVGKVISYPRDSLDPRQYDLWFYSSHGSNCDVSSVFLQNMRAPVACPSWRSSLIHEADHYMDIAYSLGYEGTVPDVDFPLSSDPVIELRRPIIGLCNGYFRTEQWRKKGWPYFPHLAEILRGYIGASVVGIGGPGELKGVPMDSDFTGKLSITQTAKVLSHCDVLVTTDTGNMHIANLLHVPLVALFGSTLVSKNGPRGNGATVLQSGMECAPCQDTSRFYNCNNAACMGSISVGDVVTSVKGKLVNRQK